MKVLFIVPYPADLAPSQRFRFEQYLGHMQLQGYHYEIHSFLLPHNWRLFTAPGQLIAKVTAVVTGFARRLRLLLRVRRFDRVFIHREAAPIGPPFFEWFIAKALRVKIIYDFDDAIWLTDRNNESAIARVLRWRGKVRSICIMSHKVSCGNSFLADYARKVNDQVVVNPTTIDTKLHRGPGKKSNSSNITIGWTGTQSTLKYLEPLRPVIAQLRVTYPQLRFQVIADVRPDFDWPTYSFVKWQAETEIADLLQFDIGVMPLPDDEWSKGKCGFKALQYMALGIPTIASPVGVNNEIIENRSNGILASSEGEWIKGLTELINDQGLREQLGKAGRQTVLARYSVDSNAANFLSLFK